MPPFASPFPGSGLPGHSFASCGGVPRQPFPLSSAVFPVAGGGPAALAYPATPLHQGLEVDLLLPLVLPVLDQVQRVLLVEMLLLVQSHWHQIQ